MLRRLAVAAFAILASLGNATAQGNTPWVDEIRVGGSAQVDSAGGADVGKSGYVQFEALFSALPAAPFYDTYFSYLFTPRPLVGATISLQGKTNGVFAGLAWNLPVPGPFLVEFSFGGFVHDQTLFEIYPDRDRLTTRFLFRESILVGYELNKFWRISAFADHLSNGNLGYSNRSVNKVGVMLGAKLGDTGKNPAPIQALQPVSRFNWSGPYAGFSGGVGIGLNNFVIDEPGVAPLAAARRGFSLNLAFQAGYNWTFGPLLVGLEGDIAAQRHETSASHYEPIREEISTYSSWLSTARARVGLMFDTPFYIQRMMVYATGGLAFAHMLWRYCDPELTKCYTNGERSGIWIDQSGTRNGWTVGMGAEAPVTPFSTVKLEYLYMNFGQLNFVYGPIRNDVDYSAHVFRIGLNFGFFN